MCSPANPSHNKRAGFTLLELLLALAILAMITAMVYAAFANVMNSVQLTRDMVEEQRLRLFLIRSFETNFATVYVDADFAQQAFRFVGEDDETTEGPRDTIQFCSSAPLIGGLALPGDIKQVQYGVLGDDSSSMELDTNSSKENDSSGDSSAAVSPAREDSIDGEKQPALLQVMETPLLAGNVQSVEDESSQFVASETYESPNWTVPVETFDIEYFNGVEWVPEWDSDVMGRLPWAVRIRINFAKTKAQAEEEKKENYDRDDDPDFERMIIIPAGVGILGDLRSGTTAEGGQGTEGGGTQGGGTQGGGTQNGGQTGSYVPSQGQTQTNTTGGRNR